MTTLKTFRPWNFAIDPPTVVNGHVYFYAVGKRYVFAAYGLPVRTAGSAS